VVTLVGWLVAGRLLRPIRLLRHTAQRISETDITDRIPVHGHDDVSELGRTFNAMLDRLQTAFQTQRDFLDDAGHELRTPLTIVRGHLELLDPHNPEETVETRQLVLDELDRMRRMVDEIVLLAKAQRPDFVTLGPVDVAELIGTVLEKASALADRDWRADRRGPGVLIGDEQRLTQALLQLAENAAKFGQPGDLVAIGGSVSGPVARLWVRDSGPGISPADRERIFDRFGRAADGSRGEGSGLGLAIVRAIAGAHGGRVLLDSRVGVGSTFTLELPASGPSDSGLSPLDG
jgi:signal transduction histidine kinase